MDAFVPLIDLSRGGLLECRHFGALAVADSRGQVQAAVGDPHALVFTRSALKPLQALPLLEAGGAELFGFTARHIALLCASHNGEAVHVEQVQAMLDKTGLTHKTLQCGCHVPLGADHGAVPAHAAFDERHHNCSGKHTGFLAYCVQHGLPLGNYLAPGHVLQQAIRRDVGRAAGLAPEELRIGIDGCSAPNYAMPLSRLARAYARLAGGAADAEFGTSFARIADAMAAHPELVSGTGRSDLALAQAGRGDWIAKGGADGVQVVASRARGQALALKVSDGNKTAVQAATVEALDQLGWLDDAQREQLRPWRAQALHNVRGLVVGERQPVFRLAGAAA